jgi:hypothetical protein
MSTRETRTPGAAPREGAHHELNIVNPDPRYAPIRLIEPTTRGYIHVAAEVKPTRFPLLRTGREKAELLRRLTELADQLRQLDSVEQVTLFDAIAMAPASSLT